MAWKTLYRAVLIKTPPSQPDRLFTERDNNPRLWEMTNSRGPHDAATMLMNNGIKAEVVVVVVEVDEPKPVQP